MGTITRRATGLLAAVLLSTAVFAGAAAPAQSATQTPTLTGIRTGVHPTFDRIVLDLTGHRPGVTSRFVDELVQDGSGQVEWLTGCEFLEVTVTPARAHTDAGDRSYPGPQKFRTRNLENVTAVAITGDFEAYLTIGVGMHDRTWVRVFTLGSPTRVIIDVGN